MQAKWKTYTKEQIYQFYTESKTWTDFFTKMGYKAANDYGYTKKQLQKFILILLLDIPRKNQNSVLEN